MKNQTESLEHASVRQYCKAVRVPTIGANFVPLAEQAVKENHSHIRYLEALLAMECEDRDSELGPRRGSPAPSCSPAFHRDPSSAPVCDLLAELFIASPSPSLKSGRIRLLLRPRGVIHVLNAVITAEGEFTMITAETENTTDTAAAVAAQAANAALEKTSSKKNTSPKKGAPKGQKGAKGGKPRKPPGRRKPRNRRLRVHEKAARRPR